MYLLCIIFHLITELFNHCFGKIEQDVPQNDYSALYRFNSHFVFFFLKIIRHSARFILNFLLTRIAEILTYNFSLTFATIFFISDLTVRDRNANEVLKYVISDSCIKYA